MVSCGINGFGRIGRLVFRYAFDDPLLDVVHVNDLCSCESAAYLIKYDSVHGTWDKDVVPLDDGSGFTVNGKLVTFTRCKDYKDVDWKSMNIERLLRDVRRETRGRERAGQGGRMSQRGPRMQRSPVDGGFEARHECELHHQLPRSRR